MRKIERETVSSFSHINKTPKKANTITQQHTVNYNSSTTTTKNVIKQQPNTQQTNITPSPQQQQLPYPYYMQAPVYQDPNNPGYVLLHPMYFMNQQNQSSQQMQESDEQKKIKGKIPSHQGKEQDQNKMNFMQNPYMFPQQFYPQQQGMPMENQYYYQQNQNLNDQQKNMSFYNYFNQQGK